MNNKPVSYLQTDARWKNVSYAATGESSTIGSAGCGPTCAAMVIATLKDSSVTPVTTCAWSVANGYKFKNQGTGWSYFVPQFNKYGIKCVQLNNGYYKDYDNAMSLIKQGWYAIALMTKGTWTSSGHFVLVWWSDDKVRILDPASNSSVRLNGDISTFKSQAKLFWMIDASTYNKKGKAQSESKTTTYTTPTNYVPTKLPVLRKGNKCEAAKAWQYLMKLDGYTISVDGVFGQDTETVTKTWQSKNGLASDGIVGANSWAKAIDKK